MRSFGGLWARKSRGLVAGFCGEVSTGWLFWASPQRVKSRAPSLLQLQTETLFQVGGELHVYSIHAVCFLGLPGYEILITLLLFFVRELFYLLKPLFDSPCFHICQLCITVTFDFSPNIVNFFTTSSDLMCTHFLSYKDTKTPAYK